MTLWRGEFGLTFLGGVEDDKEAARRAAETVDVPGGGVPDEEAERERMNQTGRADQLPRMVERAIQR